VTLPEVVTGELPGKFGEISLFDQHADFELGSASNSNSTSPWAIVCEPASQPSHVVSPPASASRVAPATSAGPARRLPLHAGPARSPYPSTTQTPTPPLATPRTPTPSSASTRTPCTSSTSGQTRRIPSPRTTLLSNPYQDRLVITSTPAERFVYWPDRKPADLIDGNSRYVAYLDSLPFQEGTPLT
jgi:hypothetical protein